MDFFIFTIIIIFFFFFNVVGLKAIQYCNPVGNIEGSGRLMDQRPLYEIILQ